MYNFELNYIFLKNLITETTRCYLRRFNIEDAQSLLDLNADPEVLKYTGDPPFENLEAVHQFIQSYDHYEKHGMGRWSIILKEDEKFIGWCGLKNHPNEGFVDLGYRLSRKYWNQGYATETARACIEYGFTILNLESIIARAANTNLASIRVMKKLGMRFLKNGFDHGNEIVIYEIKNGQE